jgi:hypothetical protein
VAHFSGFPLYAHARVAPNWENAPHAPPTPPFFSICERTRSRDVCDVRIFRQTRKTCHADGDAVIAADLRKEAS